MTAAAPDRYRALIFAASGGIGAALADALQADPRCALTTLSRRDDGVDLTEEDTLAGAAESVSGDFDLIINAAGALEIDGAPPEKAFREIEPQDMTRAFEINAVGGAMFLKHFLPRLATDRRAVFASLSARVGSIGDNGLGGWMSYRASKAALNQIVRCAAIEARRANKQAIVSALHPGTIKTPLTEKYARGRYTASPDECARNLLRLCAELTPEQSGAFLDYAGETIPW